VSSVGDGDHGGDNDGGQPQGTLISDKLGNLYDTAANGSSKSQGVVFELSPPATTGGAWKETVIFFFAADGSQGGFTLGNLIFDGVGNLYGTARYGGTVACGLKIGCGTVFQLRPPATPGGSWTPTGARSGRKARWRSSVTRTTVCHECERPKG
jgi:hypothetical protein